ncbi:MAG: 30S ribosomal protein S4 [Flavobacteriales bacterium]|jgi:small subunit ribosomal protein S4|nr:30S ribosomal protein S4 [Flavobacteriales bacterium]|tara:strand:- start:1574 stop:2179 length:606 start_codon:yes stop_codon:yes gene_type:complete
MARYIGPKTKIARKFSDPIFGADKYFEKRKFPPGQHGPNGRRGKKSDYALQLAEKQKAKYTYGILEKQFSNLFKKASRSKMITGEALLQFCELRLDNIVYRLGISNTRNGARQLVSHKHITVNGSIVNIPSYLVKMGDVISVRQKSKSLECISSAISKNSDIIEWLEWNIDVMKGKLINVPNRDQIPENIKEQLIVELYSK